MKLSILAPIVFFLGPFAAIPAMAQQCKDVQGNIGSPRANAPSGYVIEKLFCNDGSPSMSKPNEGYCNGGSVAYMSARQQSCDWDTANSNINSGDNCVVNRLSRSRSNICNNQSVTQTAYCPSGYTVEAFSCSTSNDKMTRITNTISKGGTGGKTYMPTEVRCTYERKGASCITSTTTAQVLCRKNACTDDSRRNLRAGVDVDEYQHEA